MNDIDRACAAFRTLLEEQQARVAGMTAEQVDYTNKATVTIGLVDGDGIGPIIMEQAVRALEVLLAMERERGDIERYINLFGYNPKYGPPKPQIGSVRYEPQPYQRQKLLYE